MKLSIKHTNFVWPVSVRAKIIVFIIIASLYPIVLMGIIAVLNYNNIIKERFITYAEGNMNRISSNLDSDIKEMKDSILWMLQDPAFNELILKQPDTSIESVEMYNLRRGIKRYLSSIVFAKKVYDVGGIYFYDNVQNIYYAKEAGLIQEEEIPFAAMSELLHGEREAQFFFNQGDEFLDLYITQQVLHKDTYKPLGMIYYRLDPDYLKNVF